MKKTNYLEPRIELNEVIVEAGIAMSPSYGMTAGDAFGEITYDDEL